MPAATAAAAPAQAGGSVARLVRLEPGLYAFAILGERRRRAPVSGLPLPAVHVCPGEAAAGFEITDETGGAAEWLGGRSNLLFVRSAGSSALVTAYLAHEAGAPPLDVEIRRVEPPDPPMPALMLRLARDAAGVPLDIVLHLRGGEVRSGAAEAAGRAGAGLWIEAFTLASPDAAASAAIEYKSLSASGSETPWLGCGEVCGAPDSGIPLLGFAVRQRAAAGAGRFDCEYTGYFQSGAAAGPLRNGAPCRSPRDNDPLAGLALRITPRPPRPAAA